MGYYSYPRELWHDWLRIAGVALVLLAIAGLLGSCIADYAKSTLRYHKVVIVDKNHVPGHYEQVCSSDDFTVGDVSIPVYHCEDEWRPPTWSVRYQDAGSNYTVGVSEGMYSQLGIRQEIWINFYEGAYFGFRYSEDFLSTAPPAER